MDGILKKNNNNQEINKLKKEIAKLEQMIGKLTMKNYILKKEKEYITKSQREDLLIVTGNYFTPQKRDAD